MQGDQGIAASDKLLKSRGADQINLYQLISYIQESKLAYKVESYVGYTEEQSQDGTAPHRTSPSTPVLHALVSFLTALTNLSAEGRIFYEKLASSTPPDIKLSYLLLSPTHAFSSIASSARAVILAGGTMSPFDDYRAHLFPTLAPEKITTLSCGHVIPASNLFVWTLSSTRPIDASHAAAGPGAAGATSTDDDNTFEFSFQRRGDRDMIRRLGLALLNVCAAVPDGVVVFFPSYAYLDEVVGAWQQAVDGDGGAASSPSIWDRLAARKPLFRDARGADADAVLRAYSDAILSPPAAPTRATRGGGGGGAVLLSVVGGKLSEGINFSDRLGRCVMVVGLPYPNLHSPEWKARLEYVERAALERLLGGGGGGATPGAAAGQQQASREMAVAQAKQATREFYENACMRAVNQSIGRVIRHRGDYAAVVLVDRRFGTERIRGKLPGWIRGGMVEGSERGGLQGLMAGLSGFFRGKGR